MPPFLRLMLSLTNANFMVVVGALIGGVSGGPPPIGFGYGSVTLRRGWVQSKVISRRFWTGWSIFGWRLTYYNTRDCPYSMKGYLLYDGKKLKSSQGLRWMDSKCQKSIKVPLNLSLFRTEYSTFTKLFGEFSGFHLFQNFLTDFVIRVRVR